MSQEDLDNLKFYIAHQWFRAVDSRMRNYNKTHDEKIHFLWEAQPYENFRWNPKWKELYKYARLWNPRQRRVDAEFVYSVFDKTMTVFFEGQVIKAKNKGKFPDLRDYEVFIKCFKQVFDESTRPEALGKIGS